MVCERQHLPYNDHQRIGSACAAAVISREFGLYKVVVPAMCMPLYSCLLGRGSTRCNTNASHISYSALWHSRPAPPVRVVMPRLDVCTAHSNTDMPAAVGQSVSCAARRRHCATCPQDRQLLQDGLHTQMSIDGLALVGVPAERGQGSAAATRHWRCRASSLLCRRSTLCHSVQQPVAFQYIVSSCTSLACSVVALLGCWPIA